MQIPLMIDVQSSCYVDLDEIEFDAEETAWYG